MNKKFTAIITAIFIITSASLFAQDCGDVNGDGKYNLLDVSYTINHLYRSGPDPVCWARPILTTAEVSDITSSTATCGGTITSDGGETVTERGVCWSINPSPTISDNKTLNGAGGGSFISSMTGLASNTMYYVRAYATNAAGTGYGMTMAFTTSPVPPELITSEVSDITETTAQCGGTIISDGGAPVTARGVCWSTNPVPTIADNITSDGAGIGLFSSSIMGLTSGTNYYIRAYATNSAGTGYGNSVQFITMASLPVLTTAAVTAITQISAQCGGNITFDGGSPVIARGVCWSTNPIPTIADYITNDGSGSGSFVSQMTDLIPGTSYYVRAYATNGVGTGYGDTQSFNAIGTVVDIDGNVYQTITIGTQIWMAENLKVTHYRNGDAIPNITDIGAWAVLTSGAYCEYNNDINNVSTYGRLYNWYATNDSRNIAPVGWHIPSDTEWQIMVDYLGGNTVAGGKMKEMGTTHWFSPNIGATNESGFTALPSGCRTLSIYTNIGYSTYFRSSSDGGNINAWYWGIINDNSDISYNYGENKRFGFSVRCIKD
jgi:uncharacterized protein (TIGR02145 family)